MKIFLNHHRYVVHSNVTYTSTITITGNVTLILEDGKKMNVGTSESRINGDGIKHDGSNYSLTIYGQTLGTGAFNIYTTDDGIYASDVTINGGHVTVDANGDWSNGIRTFPGDITINGGTVNVTATGGTNSWGLYANSNVTINGGTVNASGDADGIRIDNGGDNHGNITINGGIVNATGTNGYAINANSGHGHITLGWTKPADRITIGTTGLLATADTYSGTVTVASGKDFIDEDGHLHTASNVGTLNGKTLTPCAAVTFAPEGYATYYHSQYDLILPAGVIARVVTANEVSGTLTYATIADGDKTAVATATVPAATAQTKPLLVADKSAAYDGDNLLYGSDTETTTTGDGKHYKLSYGSEPGHESIFGWYWGADNGTTFTTAAHKAWLVLPTGTNARFFNLPDWGEASGIKGITNPTPNPSPAWEGSGCAWYTLDGRKLDKQPTKAGIYVRSTSGCLQGRNNDKKVVIK